MSLVVEGLTVALRHGARAVPLIENVSLAVQTGESLSLVGESGAGKSVLCRAIAGLLDPPAYVAAGRVLLRGNRVDQFDARRMRAIWGTEITLLLQDPGACLDPMATVGAQIAETLVAHGRNGGGAQGNTEAIAWLARVGLPDPETQARSYPHQLSGGMKQRAALALALCSRPRVLLADEPTSALDALAREHVVMLLRELCAEQGIALLLVTHDMHVARAAGRMAVLYAGRIVECGPAAAVLNAPAHPYTQALAACLPRIDQPRHPLPVIDGAMPAPGSAARAQGCVFAPRCRIVEERCMTESPGLARRSEAAAECACWKTAGQS